MEADLMGWNFVGLRGAPSETSMTPEEYMAGINRAATQRAETAREATNAANAVAQRERLNAFQQQQEAERGPCGNCKCGPDAICDMPGRLHDAYRVPRFKGE